MQQLQSSSTLHNYISSGQPHSSSPSHQQQHQHQQSSLSQCVQCQHINNIEQHSSSQQSSSSGDNGELVQPLHRHIIEHSRQIEMTIGNLQQEIEKLKLANSSKDVVIEQLMRELKELRVSKVVGRQQKDGREVEFFRRQQQIDNLRRQLYENSAKLQQGNNFSKLKQNYQFDESVEEIDDIKKRIKHIEVKFQDRRGKPETTKQKNITYTKRVQVSQRQYSSSQSESSQQQRNQPINHQPIRPSKPSTIPANRHPSFTQQPKKNLQPSSQTTLHQQLSTFKQKINRLQSHVQFCEQQMLWMTNFIIAFLRMSEKFMGRFGEHVMREEWSMKKKTKVAWRYVKHLLGWFVDG